MSDKCGVCNSVIHRNAYGILCSSCEIWHHIKCVDLTVADLNRYDRELKKGNGERWNCASCSKALAVKAQSARKSLPLDSPKSYTLEDVMEKLINIESQQQILLAQYESQIKINENFQNQIDELNNKLTNLLTSKTSSLNTENIEAGHSSINNYVINELHQREIRKKNIIIFGHPEVTERNEEKQKIINLLRELSPTISEENVIHAYRLGKKQNDKPRPLKVILQNPELVRVIINDVKNKLKTIPNLQGISITFDRTPAQMKEYAILKEELNQRLSAGESNLCIKYLNDVPKIVKVKSNLN